MANYDYVYVERKTSVTGQTGTKTFELPEKGFIPEIIVRAYSTPTASSNPALPLIDAITKIEIVDGSETIKSLTGNQIKALEMIHGSKKLAMTSTDDNSVEGYEEFRLILGKKINGVNYAPDFSRFSNPQMNISWDYSKTTTDKGMSCDADTSPSMKFTILCKVLRSPGGFVHGYIKSAEERTWTQAANTEKRTRISIGDQLLGIGVDCGYDAKNITDDLSEISLNFNNREWIPFHFYDEDVVACQNEWFGEPCEVTFRKDVKDGVEVDVHMGYVTGITITAGETIEDITYSYPSMPSGIETLAVKQSGSVAYSTYHQAIFTVTGFMPFHMWYCPMSALTEEGKDTIDTNQYRKIELICKSGSNASTSSTPAVISEFLITR